jgi:hypothetical protein
VSREAEILLTKLDEFAAELPRFRAERVVLIPAAEGNKFCPLIRGHLMALSPEEGCTEGPRLHDRADGRASARLRRLN